MNKNTFIDFNKLFDSFAELFLDELSEEDKDRYEDVVEQYAWHVAANVVDEMNEYVHMNDTRMMGNFANIREDWNVTKDFVKSEVEPWGDFDEVVKSIDNNTISKEDLKKFQTWAEDWFYTAFGTWGLVYNFNIFFADFKYRL